MDKSNTHWDFYNSIENKVLLSSNTTDEFLLRMKKVDLFFGDFERIVDDISVTIKNIDVNQYIIKETIFEKIKSYFLR
jgi:hypothetical protein